MRRWFVLVVLFVAAGTLAVWGGRRPRVRPASPVPSAAGDTSLALILGPAGLEPERSAVPKAYVVRLRFANRSGRPATVVLAGYEGRLDIGQVPDGGTWEGRFVSELPGEGFAWVVNGEPLGRLAVTGSHLSEGAR